MIALDTTALSLLFVPNATSSTKSGKSIKHAKERMEHLVERISRENDLILIPTPSLSEVIVQLERTRIDELLKSLKASPWFRVGAFDSAAAVELGIRTADAIAAGDKREGLKADHTKIKFDRQIVSIALVNGATQMISDDRDVAAICERWGLPVVSVQDLPLPEYLIPPPLLANLENDGEETDPLPAALSESVPRSHEDKTGAKAAEAEADEGENEASQD